MQNCEFLKTSVISTSPGRGLTGVFTAMALGLRTWRGEGEREVGHARLSTIGPEVVTIFHSFQNLINDYTSADACKVPNTTSIPS